MSPSEIIDQTLSPTPPLWPVSYDHLAALDTRDDTVPNRLATNIGPLLGVPYPDGPLGNRCWFGDYSKLTLGEIGQGVPRDVLDDTGGPLKGTNVIVPATLHKYGPSAKHAVALTGVNRLFEPQTKIVEKMLQSPEFGQLSDRDKVRSWSGAILGTLWCQPLLFTAGVTASVLQNVLRPNELPVAQSIADQLRARCEIQSPGSYHPAAHDPFEFHVIHDSIFTLAKTLGIEMDAGGHRTWLLRNDLHRTITRTLSAGALMVDSGEDGRAIFQPTELMPAIRDVLANRLRREVLIG